MRRLAHVALILVSTSIILIPLISLQAWSEKTFHKGKYLKNKRLLNKAFCPSAVTRCITSQWNRQQSCRIENNVIPKWFSLKMWTDYKDWKREKRITITKGARAKLSRTMHIAGRMLRDGRRPPMGRNSLRFASAWLRLGSTSPNEIAFWLCPL